MPPQPGASSLAARDDKCTFTLVDGTDAMANAIRRTLLMDVPVLATDTVRILTNSSSFPDEYIAHRIGLVPLSGALESSVLCLDVTGPAQVLAGDLTSPDRAVQVVAADTLLVELLEDQKLHLEAHVVVGTGKRHARWCAAVAPAYRLQTRGVDFCECFCEDTPYGTQCPHCGHRKRDASHGTSQIDHKFSFETTGAAKALAMLTAALAFLRHDLGAIADACERKMATLTSATGAAS